LISLSIVIPAYNEEGRLPKTLETVIAFVAGRSWTFAEIIVVDDGSRDATASIVERIAASNRSIRLLRNPGNRGKGYSVRHGMTEARGDWALFSDADLSAPIEEFDKLMDAVREARAEVAIGSRALDRSLISIHQPLFREYSGRFFNLVMRAATGLPFRDTQCGFKLFCAQARREIFRRQLLNGFGFDVETLFIARRLGYQIVEVPVRWADVEGTKVSALRGLDAFADIVRVRRNALAGRYD
jgi:glycosyltransferase involved in cell wall biosynthesis